MNVFVVEKMASPKVSFIWTFHLYNYARAIAPRPPIQRYSMNTQTCTGQRWRNMRQPGEAEINIPPPKILFLPPPPDFHNSGRESFYNACLVSRACVTYARNVFDEGGDILYIASHAGLLGSVLLRT